METFGDGWVKFAVRVESPSLMLDESEQTHYSPEETSMCTRHAHSGRAVFTNPTQKCVYTDVTSNRDGD